MNKNKNTDENKAPLAMREGFNPDEARDVELSAKWYQPEPGSVIHFLALQRSDDVSSVFPDKNEDGSLKAVQRAKHVWKCELMGPAILFKDQKPVQGKAGDIFLMFEQSRASIRNLLADSAKHGFAVTLINKGKEKRFIRSQNATREVWNYDAKVLPKRFEPIGDMATVALPTAEQAKQLPEAITTAGESGD